MESFGVNQAIDRMKSGKTVIMEYTLDRFKIYKRNNVNEIWYGKGVKNKSLKWTYFCNSVNFKSLFKYGRFQEV